MSTKESSLSTKIHQIFRRYKVAILQSCSPIPVLMVGLMLLFNLFVISNISHDSWSAQRKSHLPTHKTGISQHQTWKPNMQDDKDIKTNVFSAGRANKAPSFFTKINNLVLVEGLSVENQDRHIENRVNAQSIVYNNGKMARKHRIIGPNYYDYDDPDLEQGAGNRQGEIESSSKGQAWLKCKENPNICPQEFQKWYKSMTPLCGVNFIAFDRNFALCQNITLNRQKAIGQKGGESITEVLNQKEAVEFYKYKFGFYHVRNCQKTPKYVFTKYHGKGHLKDWIESVSIKKNHPNPQLTTVNKNFTIAVTRYEYVNWYHSMTDFYNAFLMMKFFRKQPDEISVLLIDAHPQGNLDEVWVTLFGNSKRLSETDRLVTYREMVWNPMGYNSMMNQHVRKTIPLIDEFREFFLQRYHVSTSKNLNCDKLDVLFIWRHDYVAHPRNPSGSILRKIYNEDEIISAVKSEFPAFNVQGIQMDQLKLKDQLELVAKTDILVGMHGAGLTHTLFLPKHGGLIEIFPQYSNVMGHFRSLSNWRGIHYAFWKNSDVTLEHRNHFTEIPTAVVIKQIQDMAKRIATNSC
ncbi:beta-(1,2)-xylosyltransferase-like [Lingula anatina]|uniref:EGF domain-specific O-linked N-acetylglucosamine transferase n=1 Tax=Lingula anatina TaxID=7574 RepID=A0A2R2MLI7_LINAN|nr:beta-(1,2)-xylosyltransferase-like [Lingula anatina]|eukprot:XP_023931081.1 beta-(1,2)-xylosyltransferase-like [Lingula anatina]